MNRFLQSLLYAYHEEAGKDDLPAGVGAPLPTEKTYTQAELDELVAGLKAKNNELISESRTAAQKQKELEEARQREHQEALRNAGKFDEFEKNIRTQYEPVIAQKDSELESMKSIVLGAEKKGVIGAMVGKFIDPSSVDLLNLLVKTEFEGGSVVTKFAGADGKVITTDPEQFIKYLGEHKTFSHLLKSDAATGGGAGGSKGGGAAKTFNEMNDAERIALRKDNPAEFDRQLKMQRGSK